MKNPLYTSYNYYPVAHTWYAQRRWRRVRRRILVPCPDCHTLGAVRGKTCETCAGSGEVERWINEIVSEEE